MHNLKKSLYLILAIVIVLVVTIAVYLSTLFTTHDVENIFKEIIGISLFIIISLFFTIKYFVVKPLLNMIKIISTVDKDGIPNERFSLDGSKEISVFANTINMMIDTIKYSRKNLAYI